MQDPVSESETGDPVNPKSKTSNVFVLSTGRCGSVTFTRACSHITNYTSGHETRCRELGEQRLAYPAHHIEADNRLSWFLGSLNERFGDDAVYVHLTRDAERVAESYNRRWTFHGSILMAFGRGVLKSRSGELDVARDYVCTVTENIAFFLADKSRVHHVDIDDPLSSFEAFWQDIGAEGNLDQALSEFTNRHNASAQAESEASGSNVDWGHTVVKQLEAARDRLQADVRQLRQENQKLTGDNATLQKAVRKAKSKAASSRKPSALPANGSKIMTPYRRIRNKLRLALVNVRSKCRNRPGHQP